MIINREVLNAKRSPEINLENVDLFEYTLEVTSVMNRDIEVFTEGLLSNNSDKKIIDFSGIIHAIFDALVKALKALFNRFLAFLAQLASMGTSFEIELRQFKERIKGFTGTVEINFPYYEYTNIKSEFKFNIYQSVYNIIERYALEYDKITGSSGNYTEKLTDLEKKLNVEEQRNMIRNTLLGRKGTDDCSDFARLLNEYYRNNTDIPSNHTVLSGDRIYNNFYLGYVGAREEISAIKKEQRETEKNINQLKSKVKRSYFSVAMLSMGKDFKDDQNVQCTLALQRKLCTLMDLITQDILLAYGQKLQAYKDYKLQCRKILVETIKACIIQGG